MGVGDVMKCIEIISVPEVILTQLSGKISGIIVQHLLSGFSKQKKRLCLNVLRHLIQQIVHLTKDFTYWMLHIDDHLTGKQNYQEDKIHYFKGGKI